MSHTWFPLTNTGRSPSNYLSSLTAEVICFAVWISDRKLWLVSRSTTLIQTLSPGVEGDAMLVGCLGACPLPEPCSSWEASRELEIGLTVSLSPPCWHPQGQWVCGGSQPSPLAKGWAVSTGSLPAPGNPESHISWLSHLSQPLASLLLLQKTGRIFDFWLLLHLILQVSLKPPNPKDLKFREDKDNLKIL